MGFPSPSSQDVIPAPASHLVPVFVVRVGGLPLEQLCGLRFGKTLSAIDELLARHDQLRAEGEWLSGLLYTVIGQMEHKPTRYKLLSLRRDIYHGRCPGRRDTSPEVLAALPAEVARALEGWLARLHESQCLGERLDDTLRRETASKLHELRRACAHPGLQCGLVLASEEFYAEVTKWLRSDRRPDPPMEGTLIKYLSRAAAKTSPFSTLTSTGFGALTPGSGRVEHKPDWARRSVVELNLSITRAITDAVTAWPELSPAVVVRSNPSLVDNGEAVRFLVRGHRESIAEVSASPTVRYVLSIVGGHRGRRRQEVVRLLRQKTTARREDDILALINRLVAVGLLETRLPLMDQSPDHLGDLRKLLEQHHSPRVEALCASLAELQGLLARYGHYDTATARSACATRISTLVDGVARKLALPADGSPRRNVFYEDTVTDADVRIPAHLWDTVGEDIGLLHRLAAIYDMSLPASLSAAEFFTSCYGPGATTDVLTFFRDFSAHGAEPSPRLAEVTSLQRHLAAELPRCPAGPDGTRRLDPELLRGVLGRCPGYLEPPRALTLHCQVIDTHASPSIVLNDIYQGRSRSLARQMRLYGSAGLAGAAVEHALPAYIDITGAAYTNLELRAPLTRYEITYPGGLGGRPAQDRIPLGELDVRHDGTTGRLHLVRRGAGARLIPQHLGTTASFLLPPLNQFLLDVFGEASYVYLRQGLSGLVWRGSAEGVERVPRLRLGQVVINRARWVVPRDEVPQRTGTLAAYLVELTRWRRAHGIPEQCFVRVVEPAAQQRPVISGKSRKPCYVDFASPFFIGVLEELRNRRDGLLMFEEVLPGRDDSIITGPSGSYAAELVVESVLGCSGHG